MGTAIGADTIDSLARLAGALSLFASFKLGRGGGWLGARRKIARDASRGVGKPADEQDAKSSGRKRASGWAEALFASLWIVLLLFLVGYLAVKGEAAMVELDGIDVVTPYLMEP